MRKRTNRIAVRLSDAELKRLNEMAAKTVLSREQFIRTMLTGYTIREAPPAPLTETIRLLRSAAGNMNSLADHSRFREVSDRELLLQTVEEIRTCVSAITERCMPVYKEGKENEKRND